MNNKQFRIVGRFVKPWESPVRGLDKTGHNKIVKKDLSQHPATKELHPGRNEPCLCGSGIKYKKCCGK